MSGGDASRPTLTTIFHRVLHIVLFYFNWNFKNLPPKMRLQIHP